jgi:hypothetical protein
VITGDIQGSNTSATIGYDFSYAPSIININFGRATGPYYEPVVSRTTIVQHNVPIADCLDTSLYNVEDVTGVWIELNVLVENKTEPVRGEISYVYINDESVLTIDSTTQNTTEDIPVLQNSADRYKLELFVPITKGVVDLKINKTQGYGWIPSQNFTQPGYPSPKYDLNEEDIFITGFQILSRSIV